MIIIKICPSCPSAIVGAAVEVTFPVEVIWTTVALARIAVPAAKFCAVVGVKTVGAAFKSPTFIVPPEIALM